MIAIISVTKGEGHGSEVILEQILRGWHGVEKQAVCLCTTESRIHRVSQELNIRTIALGKEDSFTSTLFGVLREIRRIPKCNVFHGWTARTFEWAYYLAKLHGARCTLSLHDHPLNSCHRNYRYRIMKYFANKSDCLVCVSQALEQACIHSGYRCRTKVITNGLIDSGSKQPAKTETNKLKIGFMGMYASWKGFAIVKQWIKATENDNVQWLLYGNICDAIKNDALSMESCVPSVCLRGHQPSNLLFKEIDILVHPSVMFDPFPTVLIEAAMNGIPAVASDIGGTKEIIIHNKTGFIFDHNIPQQGFDFLNLIVQNNDLRTSMALQARRLFEKEFSIDKMVQNYKLFWNSFLLKSI